jgi:hypothetical protein
MFKLHKKSIVYIYCPADSMTGGPEALHQLCSAINEQGGKARMVYIDYSSENIVKAATPLPYKIYCSRSVTQIEDNEENIVIVPEIWPHLLKGYQKIQKGVWWLSVNYLRSEEVFADKTLLHLYQSFYAKQFLLSNNVSQPLALFDYLNIPFRKNRQENKLKQICYNPKKGIEVTNRIIERLPDITFIALKGFSKKEMAKVLSESAMYIDFGAHPGKDRIPREAAMAGSVVITSVNGSAVFFEDIPIDSKYKFKDEDIDAVCHTITTVMAEYSSHINDFDYYCRVIRDQKKEFYNQVATLLVGKNFNGVSKFVWGVYKVLPLGKIIPVVELVLNRLVHTLSPSAKKNIRKLLYFKK